MAETPIEANWQWQSPPKTLFLAPDEVHVWRVSLKCEQWDTELSGTGLADCELVRARSFRFEADRRRFVVSHIALRSILGLYLGFAPVDVPFDVGPYGKPRVASRKGSAPLRFNLSHSDELALLAVSMQREVGVDVEFVRPISSLDHLAALFFSAYERETLKRMPPERQLEAFLRCWTRKEAYLKGCGDGIAERLRQFDVSLHRQSARLLEVRDRRGDEARWALTELPVGTDYIAALAVEGEITAMNNRLIRWVGGAHFLMNGWAPETRL